MAAGTRGFSRRTLLLAMGGGAASASILWAFRNAGLPFLGAGDDFPVSATFDPPAEHDGWLVTAEEKGSLVLVEFTDGWYAREWAGESSWRWTQQVATLAFPNPRTDVALDLEYNPRTDLFEGSPRTLTITVGDQVARSLVLDATGRQHMTVSLPVTLLGETDRIEVRIAVDRPFVPADLRPDSQDTRELGIQVYRVAVER
ncbi:MAG: hypothetical protein F4Y45_04540 [Acidobacteria bacterium]|nr:hypothetical protein [Acidobacteriota bacterium]MYJ06036.1 hypothetical protein [Acidobacteriota bacterium]